MLYSNSKSQSIEIMEKKNWHFYTLCIITFIAAQRLILPDLAGTVFIAPLVFSILAFLKGEKGLAITYCVLSIFMLIDHNPHDQIISNNYLRYLAYIWTTSLLINISKVRIKGTVVLILISIIYSLLTLNNLVNIDTQSLIRDIIVLLLLGIVLSNPMKIIETNKIRYDYLAIFITIFLFSELLNILFFKEYIYKHLLADSTKFLIVLPSLYFLHLRKNIFLVSVLIIITLSVLVFYLTRILILSYLAVLIMLLLRQRLKQFLLFVAVIATFSIGLANFSNFEFKGMKTLSMFYVLAETDTISDLLITLDTVRYAESQMFFSQPMPKLLFGNGLGAAIADSQDFLHVLVDRGTLGTYSDQELSEELYLGFHDIYTDFGFRFGLVFVLSLFLWILKNSFSKHNEISFRSILLFLALINAFFSYAGLIMCAAIAKDLLNTRNKIQ